MTNHAPLVEQVCTVSSQPVGLNQPSTGAPLSGCLPLCVYVAVVLVCCFAVCVARMCLCCECANLLHVVCECVVCVCVIFLSVFHSFFANCNTYNMM
jgi:hypothetical protein